MKARRILAIGVWYFLITNNLFTILTQVGPFATETACQNYQTRVEGITSNLLSLPCFSTTSKQ
jgi:hypothetical protein